MQILCADQTPYFRLQRNNIFGNVTNISKFPQKRVRLSIIIIVSSEFALMDMDLVKLFHTFDLETY